MRLCRLPNLLNRGLRSAAIALAMTCVAFPAPADASHTQQSLMQDNSSLFADPAGTIAQMRLIGAQRIRLFLSWGLIAKNASSYRRPNGFKATDPAAYPSDRWSIYDGLITLAQQQGMSVDLDIGGAAPLWATGPGAPGRPGSKVRNDHKPHPNWDPSPKEYGYFVRAVGTRYSGHYTPPGASSPLPRVNFFSIWNEPNYGPSLAPQGLPGNLKVDFAPQMYRNLLDVAWSGLQATGHGHDTILFGEIAPRGVTTPNWGVFQGIKAMVFVRSLYCLDSKWHKFAGTAARERGCPTSGSSAGFRRAHPALFSATGFADHPYMRWYPPNHEAHPDPDYTSLGQIGVLEHGLDRIQRTYGSHRRIPIWNTEFGYITSPPKHPSRQTPWVSQSTAAYYLNWAEYLSWRDSRMQSTEQYLLKDIPVTKDNDFGGFASGLETATGAPKRTYSAYQLPLYMPVTKGRSGRSLEVWGCARPAPYAIRDTGTPQQVNIQFSPSASSTFTTVQTVTLTSGSNCYFDTKVPFSASGTVRLTWDYPVSDPLLGNFPVLSRQTVSSRLVHITIR